MDIPIHAAVQCADGPDGQVDHIIVDPTTKKITYIVVRETGLLGKEVMVPMEDIIESTPTTVHIRLLRKELESMQEFVEKSYYPATNDMAGYSAYPVGGAFYRPYYLMNAQDFVKTPSTLPEGAIAVHRRDVVKATDGNVGYIDEFLVDPRSDVITHLVLREGHLWGQKHVTIPVAQIASILDGVVQLKLSKQEIEALPAQKLIQV